MMMWPDSSKSAPLPEFQSLDSLELVHILATRLDEDNLLMTTATFQTW